MADGAGGKSGGAGFAGRDEPLAHGDIKPPEVGPDVLEEEALSFGDIQAAFAKAAAAVAAGAAAGGAGAAGCDGEDEGDGEEQ
ncbi:MAG: hypothetical protein J3K34DRAFT_519968 [Monoraphidium minutum]|nr:MAG: hypothetical protein J3K34DRAFT_519968 [Monoraphidium minutum]